MRTREQAHGRVTWHPPEATVPQRAMAVLQAALVPLLIIAAYMGPIVFLMVPWVNAA